MSGKYVSRPASSSSASPAPAAALDSVFVARCPALWEYLSLCQWEDASPREPATLILVVEEGRWKACLSDRANGRVGWRTADTLAGLLDALEAALVTDVMDWRRAKAPPGRRGRQ